MELTQILTIAGKEFRDRMRNRWVLAVALVFTVFSLVIAYFGGAQQGAVGFRSIEFTIASLVSLVIYLIPLIALLLGFDAIVGERERGSLDLLLSLPITRLELLLGKYLGLAAALTCPRWRLWPGGGAAVPAPQLGRAVPLRRLHAQLGAAGLAFLSMAVLLSVLAATAPAPRAWPSPCGSSLCWCSTCCCWACWWPPAAVWRRGLCLAAAAQPGRCVPHPERVFARRRAHALRPGQHRSVSLGSPAIMGGVMVAWIVLPLALANWRFK
jgi:Cu-processing system permease protein